MIKRRAAWQASRAWAVEAWPLLQGTAAATLAWVIAKHVVDHHEPFFGRSPLSWRSTLRLGSAG